jgi:hypothetical protein
MLTPRPTQLRRNALVFLVQTLMALATASALTAAAATNAAPHPPVRQVEADGYVLHRICTGDNASPAVLIESGASGISADWYSGQKGVSAFARACSFVHAGTAGREVGPQPRTFRQTVYELHKLWADAEFKGPYFLLGHSFDGIMLRNLPWQFPSDAGKKVPTDPAPDPGRSTPSGKPGRLKEGTSSDPIPTAGATAQPAGKEPPHPAPAWTLACAKSWPAWPCHIIVSHYPPIGS